MKSPLHKLSGLCKGCISMPEFHFLPVSKPETFSAVRALQSWNIKLKSFTWLVRWLRSAAEHHQDRRRNPGYSAAASAEGHSDRAARAGAAWKS